MNEERTRTGLSSFKNRKGSRSYPFLFITEEMIRAASILIPKTRVIRTVASPIDTLSGHLGEFVFAHYFYGNWRKHRVGKNKGQTDFGPIEVKTSAFPFSEDLHLLVREDYARKRKPGFYVQIILDVVSPNVQTVRPGTKAILAGFATSEEIEHAAKKDFGSKFGGRSGYLCHYIPIYHLHPIEELKKRVTPTQGEDAGREE